MEAELNVEGRTLAPSALLFFFGALLSRFRGMLSKQRHTVNTGMKM